MTSSPGAASSQLTVVRPVARRGGYARTVRGGRSVTATHLPPHLRLHRLVGEPLRRPGTAPRIAIELRRRTGLWFSGLFSRCGFSSWR